jgi:endoglycosylceramidase
LVVDTKEVENPSYERVEFIFERINETGKRMNVPVLVGEWGAFNGKSAKMAETARQVINLFEGYRFSNTYWAYYSGIEDEPYFQKAIVRPYPAMVSGQLLAYNYDFNTGKFTCEWQEKENSKYPTEIYVPNLRSLTEKEIKLNPSTGQIRFEYEDKSDNGRILISPAGNTRRTLTFNVLY